MNLLAIIGGSGLTSIDELQDIRTQNVTTPYGPTSCEITMGRLAGLEIVFLPRHGNSHSIPPHQINYRANIWALQSIGITHVIAVAAVGGIHQDIPPGKIIIPDQIIDYTYSRKNTYFDGPPNEVKHIDFTNPYCDELRQALLQASKETEVDVFSGGTYGAAQGPRLETAAEICRMEKEGCHIVGMTGMPEAALARELELCYATCALSINWAAGKGEKEITMQAMQRSLEYGMAAVKQLLVESIKQSG